MPRVHKSAAIAAIATLVLLAVGAMWAQRHGMFDRRAAVVASPVWVSDPREAGDNRPPVGRSLFDYVVAARGEYDIPFPFSALRARIRSQLGATGEGALESVLIPAGRSLQRSAAAPAFFRFPRAVVAVVGASAETGAPLLKDRLYLGYQEKANVIEVISYNEAAGRFEFQVVKDYRAGAKPTVFYANRALCIACHQNAAPIFARPLWDETHANAAVAARLVEERRAYYDIDLERASDSAYAIDNASDRANRYALTQLLWRGGCGDAAASRTCRADLFAYALLYRLTGARGVDTDAATFRQLAQRLQHAWQLRWPAGLAVASADIPNRNPFNAMRIAAPAPTSLTDDSAQLLDVAAALEPLTPRAPAALWRGTAVDTARLVADLAEFFTDADAAALDRHLSQNPGREPAQTYSAPCVVTPARAGRDIKCLGADAGFDAYVRTGGAPAGTLRTLRIGDYVVRDREIGAVDAATGTITLAPIHGLRPRLQDGRVLAEIAVRDRTWTASTRDDFAAVRSAIAQWLRDDARAFGAEPVQRAPLLTGLYARLGARHPPFCCTDAANLPPLQVDDAPLAPSRVLAQSQSRGLLRRYCARCHDTADPFPPNFLHGDASQVERNLAQCAPRMYFRLDMWMHATDARAKTPMPPVNALSTFDLDEARWTRHADLSALRAEVKHIVAQRGDGLTPAGILGGAYETLPPCHIQQEQATRH